MLLEPILPVGIAFLAFGLLLRFFLGKPSDFPPGPIRLPIIGSLPFLKLPIHEGLFDLYKKYGPIFSVYFGNYSVVVLCDMVLIREAFKNDKFSGRPMLRPVLDLSWGMPLGIGFNVGEAWAEQRRFTLKSLRDFGFGRNSMEEIICEEIQELIKGLKSEVGQAVDITHRFNLAALNSLLHILTGTRYPHDDPKLNKILFLFIDILGNNASSGAFYFMPWLTKLFPNWSGYNKSMAKLKPLMDYIQEEIEAHKNTCKYDAAPRDFIDVYLKQIRETTDTSSSFHKDIGEKSLAITILDLISAGGDTTATTMSWGILYAAMNPRVQTKVQEEIDAVLGSTRAPSLADRLKMPYTEAFFTEVLRMSSIVPIGIFHNTTCTASLYGYTIPKDTIIIANLWQIHHDHRYWRDPNIFRPERYFNPQGEFIRPENVIPFSMGKRVCLGEALARDQLFLFFTTVFQQFTFEVDPSNPLDSSALEPSHGIVSKPKPFKVLLKLRKPVPAAEQ